MVLEHTVGALITRFASKYIDNLDLSALRLSVFGGDVVLNIESAWQVSHLSKVTFCTRMIAKTNHYRMLPCQ